MSLRVQESRIGGLDSRAGGRDDSFERALGQALNEFSGREASARARSWGEGADGGSELEEMAAMHGWSRSGERGAAHPPTVDGFNSTLERPEAAQRHARP